MKAKKLAKRLQNLTFCLETSRSRRDQSRRLMMERLEVREVFAAFTPGNLAIYRVGDGTGSLVNTGNPVFIDEYSPTGTFVQSLPMPTTVSGSQKRLVASGISTSEGLISRSADGQYLVLSGYDSPLPGSASLSGTSASTVNRVIGRIASDGTVDTSTALTDASSGNNVRSVASTNGSDFWVSGGSGGLRYTTFGSTTSIQINTGTNALANVRQTNIYGDQLYLTTGSGSSVRLGAIGSGTPTTGGQNTTNIPGFVTSGSPYAFFFADLDAGVAGVDTLYVASDDAAALTKYSLVGGTWTAKGTIGVGGDAYRGVTGVVSGSTVTLYATRKGGSAATGGGELVSMVDASGYNGAFAGTPVVLATAAANTAFRGVALAPINPDTIPPEISTLSPTDNETNVAIENNLVATFNESIVKGTGDILIRKTSDNSIAFTIAMTSGQVTVSGAALTIDPPANLENSTEYYVQIPTTAIRDLAGNAFSGITETTTWSFTTAAGADTTPPSVTSLSPADNATGVALNTNLVVTFSENVLRGTGDILIRRSDDNTIVQTIDVASGSVTVSGDTVTINPPSDLLFLSGYYVQIPDTAFRDAASNYYLGINDTTTWNFTTINDTVPPTVVSIDDGDANNKVPVNATLTYTIVFNEDIDAGTVDAADFDNEGTSDILIGTITETTPGTFTIQVTSFSSGTLKLRIPPTATITDAVGNALVVPVSDNDTVQVFDDATPPTVLSITDDRGGAPINANLPIVYTITLSEEVAIATVSASDFSNAGTASITVSSVSQPNPGVLTLTVTPRSAGTLQLQIPLGAIIEDPAGNELVTPVLDDAVITVNPVTTLTAGDIAFTGIQTDDPDTFSFVLLKDVVDGTEIRFTDNRWTNSSNTLATNENTLALVFQNAGVGFPAGTHFVNINGGTAPAFRVVGTNTSAGIVTGAISGLAVGGDSLLAYQGTVPTNGNSSAWIAGISSRSWSSGATNNESELPSALTNGVNAIQLTTGTDIDNGAFQISTFVGSIAEIRSVVNNIKNWTTSNDIGPASNTSFSVVTTSADLYISEVIFDAVPATDTGEEYIELRGTPNTYLPGTSYLLLLDGDSEDEAGSVDHRFYLGGMQFGSNGFLVLRQFGSTYTVDSNATVVTATTTGWGASWSSRDTDIENGSVSVLLVLSSSTPAVGIDVDTDNNGNLDGDSSEWTIRDSIGNIDGGASDTGYGVLNTTGNGNGTVPTGSTLINLNGYHPDYMARNGASTGYALINTASSDWVVGELAGAMPTISLATGAFTRPSVYAGAAIDHLGAVNTFVPPNSAPTDIGLSSSTIVENAGTNATVGALTTTDPDSGNTFTYTLTTGIGDSDNADFNIDGNTLRATNSFDFETKSSYTLRIRSTDQGGLFTEKAFTITITNVNESPVLTRSQANVTGNVLSTFTNSGTWSDPEGDSVTLSASLGTVTRNGDGTWSWAFVPSQVYTNQIVTITGNDGNSTSQVQFTIDSLATIVNSKVFYKGSSFANTSVNAALDPSKVIAKSGATTQLLTFANLVNTTRGINGFVLDVAGLAASSLTASDFVFRVSPTGAFNEASNPPRNWVSAPAPTLIDVIAGTSTTPARVRLEWTDNAIANRWLQIKVLANSNTGLLSPQVYYLGHLQGETNGLIEGGTFRVRGTDVAPLVAAINSAVTVPVENAFDLNKDGRIRGTDSAPAVASVGLVLTRITIPVSGSADEGEGISGRSVMAVPAIEVSKGIFVAEDRHADPIRPRWTDSIFYVPLPTVSVPDVATVTSERAMSAGADSISQGKSDLSLPSLDEYFAGLGKQRSNGLMARKS